MADDAARSHGRARASLIASHRVAGRRIVRAAAEADDAAPSDRRAHQPITKSEIEGIRGVIIGQGILDQLMELNWIQPGGRKEVPGRPILWNTTDEFLLHFGLGTLDNLPGIEELRSSGILNENFSSLNIQEVSDSLDPEEALIDDNEDENLDDFSQSQLDDNTNDT